MSDLAIRVENLGKMYRIGRAQQRHDTLRDALQSAVCTPLERLQGKTSASEKESLLWALKDISFEVKQGEVVGVIGHNGAGKSTLLKILARITEPTMGRAVLNGRAGSLLEVGTGFHPELTGRENIYLNGAILGMKRVDIAHRFDEIVAFAEIEKFLDTPVKRYSSGMYVRLAFAIAAHLEPDILLVDEVLAVGDAAFQKKCLGKMGEVAKEGRTILLVSHNLTYITYVCSRALLLRQGVLIADGSSKSTSELYIDHIAQVSTNGVLAFDTSRRLMTPQVSIPLVEVLSEEGRPVEKVQGGLGIRVRIHYDCRETLVSPSFAVVFSAPNGVELLRLSTMPISGYQLPDLYGTGYVDCLIKSVPFTGGTYTIGVGLGRPNVEYMIFERVVGGFEIPPYDAYNSGFGVDQRCGVLTAPHEWEIMSAMGAAEADVRFL